MNDLVLRGQTSTLRALLFLAATAACSSSQPDVTLSEPVTGAACDVESRIEAARARFAGEAPPPQIDETRVRRAILDPAGDVHVVLDSRRHGHRVLGAEILRHELASGASAPNDSLDLSGVHFDDTPARIDGPQAEKLALAAVADQDARPLAISSELLYEREADTYRLTFRVDLTLDPIETELGQWIVWIDPADGHLIQRREVTRHTQGIGHSLQYRRDVRLQTFFYPVDGDGGGGFVLEDWLRPRPGDVIQTMSLMDARGRPVEWPGHPFFDEDDVYGNGQDLVRITGDPTTGPLSETGQTSAVDAHHSAAWAWDLYVDLFDRQGPYGDGSGFTNLVHFVGLTHYQHSLRTLFLGMGYSSPNTSPPTVCAAGTDVGTVAHEIGHGFFATEILTSSYAGETGGIDEATSDIIEKLTEIYAFTSMGIVPPGGAPPPAPSGGVRPSRLNGFPPTWPDWSIWICRFAWRNMRHPSLKLGEDAWSPRIEAEHMDPHLSSGPINRMFYFLSEGVADTTAFGGVSSGESSPFLPGGMAGIGIASAADLFYRGVVGYLPRVDPKFADLRAAMEKAAGGSVTFKKAVQDAFAAVNVGPPADRAGPTISNVKTPTAPGKTITATVTDPSGVGLVDYSTNQHGFWGGTSAAPYAVTVPAGITTGTYQVTVCATDTMENSRCIYTPVVIDATKPTVTLFDVPNPYAPSTVRLVRLKALDNVGLASAEISLGTPVATQLWSGTFAAGTKTIDVLPTVTLPAGLLDGTYRLDARVKDLFDQTTSSQTTVTLDRTPPECAVTGMTNVYTPSDTIFATASDVTSGVNQVEVFLDGATLYFDTPAYPPGYQSSFGVAFTNAAMGPHTARVTCRDRAGNSTSVDKIIIVSARPAGSVSMVSQSASPTRSAVLRLRVSDADGIKSIDGFVNCTTSLAHDVSFGLTGQPITFDKTVMVSGLILGETCEAFFWAKDLLGLESLFRLSFTVVNPGPPPPPPTGPSCSEDVHSGANVPVSQTIDVGRNSGWIDFSRNTYNVPDAMTLRCADGGTINGSTFVTTGCESTQEHWLTATMPFSCSSHRIKVDVMPNCSGTVDTAWDFVLGCGY